MLKVGKCRKDDSLRSHKIQEGSFIKIKDEKKKHEPKETMNYYKRKKSKLLLIVLTRMEIGLNFGYHKSTLIFKTLTSLLTSGKKTICRKKEFETETITH